MRERKTRTDSVKTEISIVCGRKEGSERERERERGRERDGNREGGKERMREMETRID